MTLKNMTEPDVRDLMTTLAGQIEATAAVLDVECLKFALVVFDDQVLVHISNCQRAETIAMLRVKANQLERHEEGVWLAREKDQL